MTNALLGRYCAIKETGQVIGVCVRISPSSVGTFAEIELPSGRIVPYRADRLIVDKESAPVIIGSGASSPAAAKLVAEAEKAASDGLNKTERRYTQEVLEARRLSGEIRSWRAQAIRLRLADDTFYWPDFYVEREGEGNLSGIEIIETKGFYREDARVKLQVAADLYRAFEFYLVFADGRTAGSGWNTRRIWPGPARSGEGAPR